MFQISMLLVLRKGGACLHINILGDRLLVFSHWELWGNGAVTSAVQEQERDLVNGLQLLLLYDLRCRFAPMTDLASLFWERMKFLPILLLWRCRIDISSIWLLFLSSVSLSYIYALHIVFFCLCFSKNIVYKSSSLCFSFSTEASFEELPRLWKIKFESGVLEELLFLGFPQEHKLPSGVTLLEYDKAVQQSVYEQFRVIHEGKLRVFFRHDLKILSWEFCASHHDEYLLRRLIAPQVNQLMCVAQEYQGMLTEGTSENKVPIEKLLASHDMFVNAENQFTTSLELPTVNELGFSKRYVRCMQIAEVLDIMKDLMTFSLSQKLGPIDSMHAYCHQGTRKECHGRSTKTMGQEKAQERSTQNVLTNGNSSPIGLPSQFNDGSTGGRSADLELLLANYYQKILRESLFNPRTIVTKPDQSHLMDTANERAISSQFQGQLSPSCGLFHNSVLAGLPSAQSTEVASKNIQQQMIDKLLQNALGKQKEQTFCETRENIFSGLPTGARATNIMSNGAALGNNTIALWPSNSFGSVRGNAESSRGASNRDSLEVGGSNLGIIPENAMVEFPPPEAIQRMHGQQFTRNDV